jgi:phospholipid/cholesterol/gamma-HCH transport system substrate-binding protein
MPRTRSIAWAELRVAITVVVALALLVVIVVAIGGESGFWWQRYPLKARFSDVKGLSAGAVVRLSGKEVGTVTSVDLMGKQVDVGLSVLKSVRSIVTTDSSADLGSISLLGEPIVNITPATSGRPLGDYEYLKTGGANGSMDQLTSSASAGIQQLDDLLTGIRAGRGTLGKIVTDDALYNEMQAFVTNANSVTAALNQGEGTLGRLAKDPAAYDALKTSLENLRAMTARINSGQGPLGKLVNDEAMGQSLSGAVGNLDKVTDGLAKGQGTAGKLLTDQQLYDRLNSMAARVDQLTDGLQNGRGTAGQLLHDQQLYENMNQAATELRGLLSDIRKDPQKYLRVRVSIF